MIMVSPFSAEEARLAQRVLAALVKSAAPARRAGPHAYRTSNSGKPVAFSADLAGKLLAEDLVCRDPDGGLAASAAGRAWLKRRAAGDDPFAAQHRTLARRPLPEAVGGSAAIDLDESPLARLARRRDRNGKAIIDAAQLAAGERLRADFTRARIMPNTTMNWSSIGRAARRSGSRGGGADLSDAALDAKRRVADALAAVGPEMAGVLVDVCCFLKGLETVERERAWPVRSAKVVLGLGLSRLAGHYGLEPEAAGRDQGRLRVWAPAGGAPEP